ncbi:hypothetical protein C8R45DRAFT_243431 [Mycena sanguinolenta]|nr:hypothetical protein C8R45DRAFT_243431 [Mycena sanguinolenta]
MSDDGGKKTGYRLEYASSGRAGCKGGKPCKGTHIAKGSLRFGSIVDFQGKTSFAWRHWGCVTSRVLENVKKVHDEAADLDGFDELSPEDQAKITKAWEVGHVDDEDIPDSARKDNDDEDDEDDEEKPKKKKAAPKKKKAAQDEDEEPKPKKKAAPRKKVGADISLTFPHLIDESSNRRQQLPTKIWTTKMRNPRRKLRKRKPPRRKRRIQTTTPKTFQRKWKMCARTPMMMRDLRKKSLRRKLLRRSLPRKRRHPKSGLPERKRRK